MTTSYHEQLQWPLIKHAILLLNVEQQRKVYDEIQEDLAVTKKSMQEEFRMKWSEMQQLKHTKCQKAGILALALTPCSKCMVRV